MIYKKSPKKVKIWLIWDSQNPPIHFDVTLWDDARFTCDCPTYKFKEKSFCKHVQNKRIELEGEYGNVKNYINYLN